MRCLTRPVRIELDRREEPERVTVELDAHDSHTVCISLYAPNRWVVGYLHSQLASCIRSVTDTALLIDVSGLKAKARLERVLRRRSLLHFTIEYRYDSRFMQRLYAEYADFDLDEEAQQKQVETMLHYYTVLECPVGASRDVLRKSYKKLVRVYHPDRVHCEDAATVNRYTQKFQLLQEAYTALRIVS
jgi:DnaJ-domain-containing protein 1